MKKMLAICLSILLLTSTASPSWSVDTLFDVARNKDGWSSASGTLTAATLPGESASIRVLQWDYLYNGAAVYMQKHLPKGLPRDIAAVNFWSGSDREGHLGFRMDTALGESYFSFFAVDSNWRRISLDLLNFRSQGSTSEVEPADVRTVYLVDLAALEEGATGARKVWLQAEKSSYNGMAPIKVSGDFKIKRHDANSGNLIVLAYSDQADFLHRPFFDYTSFRKTGVGSGRKFVFTRGLDSIAADTRVSHVTFDQKDKFMDPHALNLVVPLGEQRTIEVPFWPVPGYGRTWLTADNEGKGYSVNEAGDTLVVNFNVEAARTAMRVAGERLAQRAALLGVDSQLTEKLESIKTDYALISQVSTEEDKARIADKVLAASLELSDDLVLAIAEAEIPKVRKGRTSIQVRDAAGIPVTGAKIHFQQREHDFLFGAVESFGFRSAKPGNSGFTKTFQTLREAGFNHLTVHVSWLEIEKQPGKYQFEQWDRSLGIRQAVENGLSLKLRGLIHADAMPQYVKSGDFKDFRKALLAYTKAFLDHYKSNYGESVVSVEVINEASLHHFDFLKKRADKIDMIDTVSAMARKSFPQATIIVNDVDNDLGQRFDEDPDWQHVESPYEAYRAFSAMGADYDANGLEWYPGLQANFFGIMQFQGPLQNFSKISAELDRYGTLSKPLHLTEFAIPSTYKDSWGSGLWKENWDPGIQGEYAKRFYTIAFSKPYIEEITYWGISDNEPWVVTGGLMDKKYQAKPVLDILSKLLNSWLSSGEVITDSQGRSSIEGFAGDYTYSVIGREELNGSFSISRPK